MVSYNAIKAYKEQYPEDECIYSEPNGITILSKGNLYWGNDIYETDEEFLDRLERSKQAGRNLFYEEWKPFEHDENSIY